MVGDVGVDGVKFTFEAVLRAKPAPGNGHLGVLQRLKCPDELVVKGSRITDLLADACFVPKHEKLSVTFKLEGVNQARGVVEIWGERYPTGKPVHVEKFVPVLGDNTWNTWYGGKHPKTSDVTGKITEDGPLKDKYLSPEFSPYRVRVSHWARVVASVTAPLGAGVVKLTIAETQFEVKFESLQIRLMQGVDESIAATALNRRFRLENTLMIEPRQTNGDFAASGRLPALAMWQATFWVAADGDRDFRRQYRRCQPGSSRKALARNRSLAQRHDTHSEYSTTPRKEPPENWFPRSS